MRPQAPTPTATPTATRPQRPQAAARNPRRRADWCSASALAAALIFALVAVAVARSEPGQEQEQGAAPSCAKPAAQPAGRPAAQPALKVTLYTAPGCAPCRIAAADLATLPGIEVARTNDCPQWVTQVPTLAWQVSTPSGPQWVQFAPKHWRGPTWRGEWPRVRQTLQKALQQALQAGPKTERIAPPLPSPPAVPPADQADGQTTPATPATPQRPTVDHRVLLWGHQLSEQQPQEPQPQQQQADEPTPPTTGILVLTRQPWATGVWHASPLVALPPDCVSVRGTVSVAEEFRQSPKLECAVRLEFQDADGNAIPGCGGGIRPRNAFALDEATPTTGHESGQPPGFFPLQPGEFAFVVADSIGCQQGPSGIFARVRFRVSHLGATELPAAATIEAFDAAGQSLGNAPGAV